MKTVIFPMSKQFGSFLADGERANMFRHFEVETALSECDRVVFDFEGVTNMTDSFCNACFGNLFVDHPHSLDGKLEFRNCSPLIQSFLKFAIALGRKQAQPA